MPKFTYTGVDKAGNKVKETVEAEDKYKVYDQAREQGHIVHAVSDNAKQPLSALFNMERINYFLSRVGQDELVMMTRNLGSMLVAGLALSRALSVIERQSTNPRMKGVIGDVRERISRGEQFNEALEAHPDVFNDLYISMVKAGEESGGVSDALKTLSTQMEKSSALRKKIKGAMIYPAIIIIIMIGIGILMMIYVMPSITDTFKSLEVDLPPTTQVLIAMSDFLNEHTIVALLGMIGSVLGFVYMLRTKYGNLAAAWVIIRLPIIGAIAKEANSAYTARTLSSLLKAGVDVIRALDITEEVVQNPFYKVVIRDAATRVEKGTALSESFIERTDLYPVLVGEMISVGEETGQISDMLEQLAVFYENEVEQKTKDLSTIIEPLLMVVIGGSVGFFALAMIAPIYSISDSIG